MRSKNIYELLVEDIKAIESGLVTLPSYVECSTDHGAEAAGAVKKAGRFQNESNHGGKASRSDQDHRKGIAWTEEEHK